MKLRMSLMQQCIADNDVESARLRSAEFEHFALAGNATFTVRNTRSGNRFTYRVRQCNDKPELYFVSVLSGTDNTTDYQYLGTIRNGSYAHGRKSRIAADAMSAQAFAWVWYYRKALPSFVEIWHEGKCGRCGRLLTTPESIQRGYGPECIKLINAA